MIRILLRCPCKNCAHKIDFPADQVGKIVQCPKCRTETELFQPDTDFTHTEPARTKPLVVIPRLAPTTGFTAREIGLRAQNCSNFKGTIPERNGVPYVLKVIGALIGVALIAATILFLDEIKALLQKLQ